MRSALFLCFLLSAALLSHAQSNPTNYPSIQKYLSLRIYPRETVDEHGGTDSLVVRTDLDGTYTMLMLDFPGAFAPVRKSMFDQWKKDAAEVFQVAQANVDSEKVSKVTKTFTLKSVEIEVNMLVDANYAASYALDIAHNAPDLVGELGCVLAMPYKGLVTVCKIVKGDNLDWVKFIRLTQPFIEKSYREQPQPISDQYFWYYQGKFTRIGVYTDDQGVHHVAPPQGLADLLTPKP